MNLFLKGLLIGIGKIIPGISGSFIAIQLGVYKDIIINIRYLFKEFKSNSIYLFKIGFGILTAIVLFSKILFYLLEKDNFVILMLFLGFIVGSVYNYGNRFVFKYKYFIFIVVGFIIINFIPLIKIDTDIIYVKYFIAGIIECFSSIIPGISGTSLLISYGMYNKILLLLSNIFNIYYIFNNIYYYLMFFLGIGISFIISIIILARLISHCYDAFNHMIMGFNIGSIFILIKYIYSFEFDCISLIMGIMAFFIGMIIECLFDKKM